MTVEERERLCIQLEGCTPPELARLGYELEERGGEELVWRWDGPTREVIMRRKLDTRPRGGQIPA